MTVRVVYRFLVLLIIFGLFILVFPVVHAQQGSQQESKAGFAQSFADPIFQSAPGWRADSEELETQADKTGASVDKVNKYLAAQEKLDQEYKFKKKDSHYYSRQELLSEKLKDTYETLSAIEGYGANPNPEKAHEWQLKADEQLAYNDKWQAKYEEAYQAETGKKSVTGFCLIATATYGSPQASEVQLVRDYRDGLIRQSYAGSRFVVGFNAWYYSFSPAVAGYIENHPLVKSVMQICLIPLLEIILLSQNIAAFMNFSPEAATVLVLIFGGMMYGLVYIFPVIFILLYALGKNGWKIPAAGSLTPVLVTWIALLVALGIGIFFSYDLLVVVTSGLLVLFSVILATGYASLGLYGYFRRALLAA